MYLAEKPGSRLTEIATLVRRERGQRYGSSIWNDAVTVIARLSAGQTSNLMSAQIACMTTQAVVECSPIEDTQIRSNSHRSPELYSDPLPQSSQVNRSRGIGLGITCRLI
jgi:hypothetical protein